MRFILYLSSTLLLWPLSAFALPLPSYLYLDPLPGDSGVSCKPLDSFTHDWALEEGPPRLEPRSAENTADPNTIPMPKRREDIIEQATMEPEGPVRRDIELALSAVGKEGPTEDSRAVRTLKERWIIQELEDLDVINVESPGEYGNEDSNPTPKKRWSITDHGYWDIPSVPDSTVDDSIPS